MAYIPPAPGSPGNPFVEPGPPQPGQPVPGPGTPPTTSASTSTPISKGGYEYPKKTPIGDIKFRLLQPALTSHYQCWFNPPGSPDRGFRKWIGEKNFIYDGRLISLSCSEAVLPGSSMMTNEINDDFTGVTERHAYRRQFDDRADFTFYVPKENYYIIRFFEYWLSYIAGEEFAEGIEATNYSYRMNYPSDYQSPALYVIKFEKDYEGKYLEYRLLQAYPISISSMPVSYDSSQLLKCTVSFTYTRYIVNSYDLPSIPVSSSLTGDSVNFPENSPAADLFLLQERTGLVFT